jgi:hypothetical protein
MKRFLSILLACLCVSAVIADPAYPFPKREPKGDWFTYKSPHFIISYQHGVSKQYAKDFSRKCEKYYDVITDRFGFNRFDFWTWENRAKIYIYKDRKTYIKATGRAVWSGAAVNIETKFISTFKHHKNFFDTALPHELAHIILREFIGRKARVPLWFEEGVATTNEKDSYLRYFLFAKGFIDNELYIPIPDMDRVRPGKIRVPSIFYATSAALIIFLLDKYKKKKFAIFCKELRDGSKFYEAMYKVYEIKDPEDLNEKFLLYMKNTKYVDIISRDNFSVEW